MATTATKSGGGSIGRRFVAALTLVAAMTGLCASGAEAASTLQVAPIGVDSGACTSAACATINYAVGQASPGDTIVVAAGNYDEEVPISTAELTIEGAVGGGTTVGPEGSEPKEQTEFVLEPGADGTTLRNLTVVSRAQGQAAITANGAGSIDDVTIENVAIGGIGPSAPPTTVGNCLEVQAEATGWHVAGASFTKCYLGFTIYGEMTGLTVEDTTFVRDRVGFNVERTKPLGPTSTGEVVGMTLRDSAFVENEYVGLYLEGISESTIDHIVVAGTGTGVSSLPSGARALVINVKAGDFGDVLVKRSLFAGSVNEGILVQARGWVGDNPTYVAAPATLGTFTLADSTVIGNGGPGVVVQNRTTLGGAELEGSRIVDNGTVGFGEAKDAPVTGVFAVDQSPSAESVEAVDDWFGCNAGPLDPGTGCDTVNDKVEAPSWLVLRAQASASSLVLGGQATVTASLDTNAAGDPAAPGPDGTPIGFASGLGVFSPPLAPLQGGRATALFTATQAGGGTASVTLDHQQLSLPLAVQAPPASAPPPAPSPAAPPKVEPSGNGAAKVVPDSGQVTIASVACASESCEVVAKSPTVKIGGKSYKIKVKVPETMSSGDSAPVKVVLSKQTREALEAEGKGRVKVKLTVTNADGTKKTVNLTVVLKTKSKDKGKDRS